MTETPLDHRELPPDQAKVLRKAKQVEWWSLAYLAVDITLLVLVMGNSQAMKTAWAEDLLALIPPLGFLIGIRIIRLTPSKKHPYGYHRAIGVSHLVSAVALFAVGALLVVESASGLIMGEHPSIGGIEIFGQVVWLGWLMVAVLAAGSVPPVILGRIKMKLARELHNRVLFADADMNKADWLTGVAGIVGVLGIGIGLWWADAVAAIVISGSILWDGIRNLGTATSAIMDARAATFGGQKPHPLVGKLEEYLETLDWVHETATRVRDQGQVFHAEAFIVPRDGKAATLEQLAAARDGCLGLDWKVHDVVLVQVDELPAMLTETTRSRH